MSDRLELALLQVLVGGVIGVIITVVGAWILRGILALLASSQDEQGE